MDMVTRAGFQGRAVVESAGCNSERPWQRIDSERLDAVKQSFVTRRMDRARVRSLITHSAPAPGDLVLARVQRLGQHTTLQSPQGRRSTLFVGDEVVLAYGARYAPDQYEGRVPNDLGTCHLLAGGGIAGEALRWPSGVRKPTRIAPVGLLGDVRGCVLNLADFAIGRADACDVRSVPVIAVAGTSMNSGKTTAAASLVNGARRAEFRVSAAKVTGTGAGNDYWMLADAGATEVLDFTDCGYASTHLIGAAALERVLIQLVSHLQAATPDLIVLEVADGLLQEETAALLRSAVFRNLVNGVIFSAADSMGASAGVDWLEQRGVPVIGVSGKLTMSPLAATEAGAATGLPVWGRSDLADPALVRRLVAECSRTAQRIGSSV